MPGWRPIPVPTACDPCRSEGAALRSRYLPRQQTLFKGPPVPVNLWASCAPASRHSPHDESLSWGESHLHWLSFSHTAQGDFHLSAEVFVIHAVLLINLRPSCQRDPVTSRYF
jgi:hypothetical protein